MDISTISERIIQECWTKALTREDKLKLVKVIINQEKAGTATCQYGASLGLAIGIATNAEEAIKNIKELKSY